MYYHRILEIKPLIWFKRFKICFYKNWH